MSERRSTGDEVPSGVGVTALIVAQARAVERQRPDRLFDDPLAESFVDRAGPSFADQAAKLAPILRLRGNGTYFAIRTRFFDDCLLDSVRSGCRQVVLLGAGLDTRAFRLDWPLGVRLFELDLPDVLAFKAAVLDTESAAPLCRRDVVSADLRGAWPEALAVAGFRPSESTAWLAEGVLMYLTEGERDRLLESIGSFSAPGSWLVLDQRGVPTSSAPDAPGGSLGVDSRVARDEADEAGNIVAERFGTTTSAVRPDPSMIDPVAWLARHGWRSTVFGAAVFFASYGRPMPDALRAGAVQLWLASAERD